MSDNKYITVKGVRVNNLKNLSVNIPLDKFIVVSGVSGSGKSSFAFDTLYAEGQRRYVESLSSYARQFMEEYENQNVTVSKGFLQQLLSNRKYAAKILVPLLAPALRYMIICDCSMLGLVTHTPPLVERK